MKNIYFSYYFLHFISAALNIPCIKFQIPVIALNSIWWHKNITKNRKLYIYQTTIHCILVYGAQVWQIPTREINKILSTEMDVLRKSARKSRMDRIKNEHIKKIMGVKGKPDIIDITEQKRLQWYGHVKRMPEENQN